MGNKRGGSHDGKQEADLSESICYYSSRAVIYKEVTQFRAEDCLFYLKSLGICILDTIAITISYAFCIKSVGPNCMDFGYKLLHL